MKFFGMTLIATLPIWLLWLGRLAFDLRRARHPLRGNTIAVSQKLSATEQRRIGLMAAAGRKIQAIKDLRELAPTDLATAKMAVEQLAEIHAVDR